MENRISNVLYSNYNTVHQAKSSEQNLAVSNPIRKEINNSAPRINFTSIKNSFRTELNKKEQEQYITLLNLVDKNTRKHLEILLKSGILLNNESNDNSTVLDNLYKIGTTPRAEGLDNKGLLVDTITTISYPYVITQQFGDIPNHYRQKALQANTENKSMLIDSYFAHKDIDVDHSGTCVAASIEFNLAEKMPAEFARFAEGLTSPNLSIDKTIKLNNLADHTLDAIWLLNAFEVPYEIDNYNNAKLKFAPDKNAIIRAQIQTTDRDSYERSPIDVLMQSTFMQIGSQQTYNSLTDKRQGKFNQNDKGLIEFEKTFTESVVENKNKLSITYQTVDENARLIGYETDFDTMKKHITSAIDQGENVIIGYTQVDRDNIIVNGHEITIVNYEKDKDGKLTFICNDTDDNKSKPIKYSEDFLLPKIHHAALPQKIVENDLTFTPTWEDGLNMYKETKNKAV